MTPLIKTIADNFIDTMVSKPDSLNYRLAFRVALKGHSAPVTSIAAEDQGDPFKTSDIIATGSEDSTIIIWNTNPSDDGKKKDAGGIKYGSIEKTLKGHTGAVTEIVLVKVPDGGRTYAFSVSKDTRLLIWDVDANKIYAEFTEHTGELLTVATSSDWRQIVTGGTDGQIKLSNTLGQCKCTLDDHKSAVVSVKFSPSKESPYMVSTDSSGGLKIWHDYVLKQSREIKDGKICSLSISSTGSEIATAGSDNLINIFDAQDISKEPRELKVNVLEIKQIAFHPTMRWLAVATDQGVQIFNLENEAMDPILEISDGKSANAIKRAHKGCTYECTSIAWRQDGNRLFVAFRDLVIEAFDLVSADD